MTMFTELYALALHATLTLTVSADEKTGKLTINVIPKPRGDTNDAALSTPLALTAPPAEFDEGFVEALSGFRAGHVSLAKQARDTAELLAAATAASASKGAKAVAKASSKLPVARAATTRRADPDADDDTPDSDVPRDPTEPDDEAGAAPAASAGGANEPNLFG